MSDLWIPWGVKKPIPPGVNDPRIKPVMFVVHRSAARGSSLFNWFSHGSGGLESHGYTTRGGVSEQYRSFDYEADAQAAGNSWVVDGLRLGAISWETEGTADDDWTPAQVNEVRRVMQFAHESFGIPLRLVDSARPQSLADGGFGWHSKYRAWNPNVHNCPGDTNVTTFRRLVAELKPAPAPIPHEPEDDMTVDDLVKALRDDEHPLTKQLRRHIREAVQAELVDERTDQNPGQ